MDFLLLFCVYHLLYNPHFCFSKKKRKKKNPILLVPHHFLFTSPLSAGLFILNMSDLASGKGFGLDSESEQALE